MLLGLDAELFLYRICLKGIMFDSSYQIYYYMNILAKQLQVMPKVVSYFDET